MHKLHHVLIRQEIDRPLRPQDGIRQLTTVFSAGRGLPALPVLECIDLLDEVAAVQQ